MPDAGWEIRLEGRTWDKDEARVRWELTPERFEMVDGMLFWTPEQRINLLAMLLENVGALDAVRLGSIDVWREALRQVERSAP